MVEDHKTDRTETRTDVSFYVWSGEIRPSVYSKRELLPM